MSNESKKDFNAKMNNSKDMPKIVELDKDAAKKWGGKTMVIAPPIDYNEFMKRVPIGKVITTDSLRKAMAKKDITAYWRTLKSNGELNAKYPESIDLQKRLLEEEGHTIIKKGTKNTKYY